MPGKLTSYEQETIINFNKAEDIAYIFTYEKTCPKHLEAVKKWLQKQKVKQNKILEYGFEKKW